MDVDRHDWLCYHTRDAGSVYGRFSLELRVLQGMTSAPPLGISGARKALPVILALVMVAQACAGPFPQSTFSTTSDLGVELEELYLTIFWWAVGVFVVVESLLVYAIIRFRARPGQPPPDRVHGNTLLEVGWTLAPAVILVFIAVPTVQTIFATDGTPDEGALIVEVVGHQWWWEYRYPDLEIVAANELHLPQGRPVGLSITSADVIHSFWAPQLGGKRDAIAGRTNRLAFTPDSVGMYLGQCAEFCGASHANMRLRVFVDDSAAFEAWVANQQGPPPPIDPESDLARQGEEAFRKIRTPANHSCIVCHTMDGMSAGELGPSLSHVGSRTTIASGILPNTAEGLRRWLLDPVGVKPGSLMPDIDLTEEEVAALVAYLLSKT